MKRIRYHRVLPGETLENISIAYYGVKGYAAFIYRHNQMVIRNPNLLDPGVDIAIPFLPLNEREVA